MSTKAVDAPVGLRCPGLSFTLEEAGDLPPELRPHRSPVVGARPGLGRAGRGADGQGDDDRKMV